MKSFLAGAVAFAAVLALGVATARAQVAATGMVSALQGTVSLARNGRTQPVAYGTALEVGDSITTATHSQVTITLDDGTQLELAESSTLVVVENTLDAHGVRERTRIDLLGGLLHSLVRHAPGNTPNYEVHTPNAVAAARGTNYDTDYEKGVERKDHRECREFTDVVVYDGVVEVSNSRSPQSGSVMVRKGHRTTVACGLLPTEQPSMMPYIAGGLLSTALIGGGVVGGVGAGGGAGGGFGDHGHDPKPPISSSE